MIKQIIIKEGFRWAQQLWPSLKEIQKQYEDDGLAFYEVRAVHADIKNRNGRVYTTEQLQQAASSLSERPLNINHDLRRTLPFPENQVLISRFEDGVVECIIQVADKKTNQDIDSGEIRHVSIEGFYLDESNNDPSTEYPTSLHFRALALLTKDDEPGDSLASIVRESLRSRHKQPDLLLSGGIMNKLVTESSSEFKSAVKEDEWSTAYVNDLPDDAFAAIEAGGKKDEDGKTVPRSLRHLPFKDASGKVDPAHVRNALARLSQTQIPPQLKSAARKKLVAAAKQVGINTSMDEAVRNFKIAKEILHSFVQDDDDATSDEIVQAGVTDLASVIAASQQLNYESGGSIPETDATAKQIPVGMSPAAQIPKTSSPGAGVSPPSAPLVEDQEDTSLQNVGDVSAQNFVPKKQPTGMTPEENVPKGEQPKGNDATGPNNPSGISPAFAWSNDQAVQMKPVLVPGGTASNSEAINKGPVRHMPNMNPHEINPGLVMSPLAITNEPHMDPTTQKEGSVSQTPGVAMAEFRFQGRKVKLALKK